MKTGLSYKMLAYWLMTNAILTICFGLSLAVICLFPASVPALRAVLAEGTMAVFLPYLILIICVSSLVSFSYFFDTRRD